MAADKEEEERVLCEAERLQILADLDNLKAKLHILIDENEKAPDDEKLPIEAFNLDKEGTQFQCEIARVERDVEKRKILEEGGECDRITDIVKSTTWDRMDVKGKNVRGIFTRLKVENYSLLYTNKIKEEELNRVKMWRENERLVSKNDVFQPWTPTPLSELELILTQKPDYHEPDEINSSTSGDSIVDFMNKHKYSLSGTSSHQFISPLPMRYKQIEVVCYHQMVAENIMGYVSTYDIKKILN